MADMKLPRRLSSDVNHPAYHPSYNRVGVRINDEPRGNVTFYDMDTKVYRVRGFPHVDHVALDIQPFWRRETESRQERRARERWELKHKVNQDA